MKQERASLGVGNLVIALYGVFALSATVRATYQIATKFSEAPFAYSLSLLAGLIYILATFALIRRNYLLARYTLIFELVGVIVVGALSYVYPFLFAHPSVWSYFGMGYGLIPLVLPVFGIWWLGRVKK